MLFTHLKRILKLDWLRLRRARGARGAFRLGATAQNLRKIATLIPGPAPIAANGGVAGLVGPPAAPPLFGDTDSVCNIST